MSFYNPVVSPGVGVTIFIQGGTPCGHLIQVPMSLISETDAWENLGALCEQTRGASLADLFDADPNRATSLAVDLGDLVRALVDARAVQERRAARACREARVLLAPRPHLLRSRRDCD